MIFVRLKEADPERSGAAGFVCGALKAVLKALNGIKKHLIWFEVTFNANFLENYYIGQKYKRSCPKHLTAVLTEIAHKVSSKAACSIQVDLEYQHFSPIHLENAFFIFWLPIKLHLKAFNLICSY